MQPDAPLRVAVVGGGGHVGRRLVATLARAGVDVHPVYRGGDLSCALDHADAVVHLAGTLRSRRGNSYTDANVRTVARTVEVARESGARRLVLLSYVGARPTARNAYLRSKGEAEELARESGLDAVIVRSTFIFGPPDSPGPSFEPLLAGGANAVAIVGSGRQRWQPVYVDDVVAALAAAADATRVPAGTYAVAGPDVLKADDLVRALNGDAVREIHLEGLVARAAAAVSPSLTQAMVDVLSSDSLPDAPLLWPLAGLAPTAPAGVYTPAGAH